MRRLDENDENKDNIIMVKTLLNLNSFKFSFDDKDTILSLKQEISKIDEFRDISIFEMCLIIDEKYPYQLINTLKLEELLISHRILSLIIKENPDVIIPSRLRLRRNISYLTGEERPYFEVINFRNIYDIDIEYISSWLDKLNLKLFIEIDCLHSKFSQIMDIIIETLDDSLSYGVKPTNIKGIVFYNYDKDVHYEVIEKFNRIIKTEENICFKRIKLIDYSTKNML